jgi:type VI secretion system secreted protein Hcp
MSSTDYKLIIESVRGEMKREGKDEGLDIQRFEFGAELARDGASGMGRQRRRYSDVKFFKLLDRASPTLQTMLATNAKIRKATLSVYKGAGEKRLLYYQITLSDAYISSYKIVGYDYEDQFGAIPRDEFSINYRKIDVDYTKQNQEGEPDGTVSFSDQLDSAQ